MIPATYPALEAEQYRTFESANERQTEVPPASAPAQPNGGWL
jgi:hypothetical protein